MEKKRKVKKLPAIFEKNLKPINKAKIPFVFIEEHKTIPVILTVLTSLFIFYISSLSSPPGAGGSPLIPKLYHFSIFFLLAFFFLASVKNGKMKLSYILLAFAFSLLYAILDELHQFFVPFRDPSFFDVMLDSSGILFSILIYALLSGELKK